MNPKRVYLEDEGKELLRKGIQLFAAAVKSTLGPSGKYVLVEDQNIMGGFAATKDGITVARTIRFEDPVMDMAASMLRQASERTSRDVGDGTTTSIVLTEAIIDAFFDLYKPDCGISVVDICRSIQTICDEMVISLDEMAAPVKTKEMLQHVATISTNNDPELGDLVSEVLSQVDVAIVEMHNLPDTKYKLHHGIKVDKGWIKPHFTNDGKGKECVFENADVLITDVEIPSLHEIAHILQDYIVQMNENKQVTAPPKPLLIIAPVAEKALEALVANVRQGILRVCVITPPSFGKDSKDRMEDLAYVLGATYHSRESGDDMHNITVESLGKTRKITVSEESTVIEPMPESVPLIEERSAVLEELKQEAVDIEHERLESRINAIKGAYAVITVGAPTPIEAKEKKDRIDDAVCALKSAKKDGILPGGGIALMEAYVEMEHFNKHDIALDIMARAVQAPLRQMLNNAGYLNQDSVIDEVSAMPDGHGLNIKTGLSGNMIEMGVIDPTAATKNALTNAVSVAITILNTESIVSHIRETSTQK